MRSHITSMATVSILAIVIAASPSFARPLSGEGWWNGYAYPGAWWGIDRVAVFDDKLVVTGSGSIDGEPVGSPGLWDGSSWSSLKGTGQPTVESFAEWHGKLLAVGTFSGLPGDVVAEWRDGDWRPFGPRMNGLDLLYSDGNRLLITAGDQMFEWSDDRWAALGQALEGISSFAARGDEVAAIVTRSRSCPWGACSYHVPVVFRNGVWQDFSPDPPAGNLRLSILGDAYFLTAVSGDPDRSSIYQWTGFDWSPVGSSLPERTVGLFEVDRELHVLQNPEGWGDGQARIFRFHGGDWSPIGEPIGPYVTDAAFWNGRIVVAGFFPAAGRVAARGLACFDRGEWTPLREKRPELVGGSDSEIHAILPFNGRVVAGGSFVGIGGQVHTGIAIGDGTTFEDLGGGVDDGVFALCAFDGNLIAAGDFLTAGDREARRVALWDGTTWQPMGSGFDERVTSLAVYRGELYAAGWFENSGSTSCRHVARWDGQAWLPVALGIDGFVNALVVHADRLIAGGGFRAASDRPARYVAAYDGVQWSPFAVAPESEILAMTVWNDHLVIGGVTRFRAEGETYHGGVSVWNGDRWDQVGLGLWRPGLHYPWVTSLGTWRGRLVAGLAGDLVTSRGAQMVFWDGTEWSSPESGPDGPIHALRDVNGSLYVGGHFRTVGDVVAENIARWDQELVPARLEGVSVTRNGSSVELSWQTAGASNHHGYEVHRQTAGGARIALGAPAISGATLTFEDEEPSPLGADYWLREIGPFESELWHGPFALSALPAGAVFGAPAPNPFRSSTSLSFTLAARARVTVRAFDAQGRPARTIRDQVIEPGRHTLVWDGRDDAGRHVPSGVYWIRAETVDGVVTRKVMTLR